MRQFFLIVLIVHLAACSGLQTVPIRDLRSGDVDHFIQVGERVEVVTRANEKIEFAVTGISADGISGKFGFIRFDDMQRLSVRRPVSDHSQETEWILGVLTLVALIALLSASDSFSVCSGGPCSTNSN